MRRKWTTFWVVASAIIVALALGAVPVAYYASAACEPSAYEYARVLAASFSVSIAAFVAVAALVQYYTNSRDKRVERSMSFWRRSNAPEFTGNLDKFVTHWIKLGTKREELEFDQIAKSDDEELDVKMAVEFILDFYDEACSGVVMGACDEEAMYFYLGPVMKAHRKRLSGFIKAWREKHHRPEKWDCFTYLTDGWISKEPKFARRWAEVFAAAQRGGEDADAR